MAELPGGRFGTPGGGDIPPLPRRHGDKNLCRPPLDKQVTKDDYTTGRKGKKEGRDKGRLG